MDLAGFSGNGTLLGFSILLGGVAVGILRSFCCLAKLKDGLRKESVKGYFYYFLRRSHS